MGSSLCAGLRLRCTLMHRVTAMTLGPISADAPRMCNFANSMSLFVQRLFTTGWGVRNPRGSIWALGNHRGQQIGPIPAFRTDQGTYTREMENARHVLC